MPGVTGTHTHSTGYRKCKQVLGVWLCARVSEKTSYWSRHRTLSCSVLEFVARNRRVFQSLLHEIIESFTVCCTKSSTRWKYQDTRELNSPRNTQHKHKTTKIWVAYGNSHLVRVSVQVEVGHNAEQRRLAPHQFLCCVLEQRKLMILVNISIIIVCCRQTNRPENNVWFLSLIHIWRCRRWP